MSNSNIDWTLLSNKFKLTHLLDDQNKDDFKLFKLNYQTETQYFIKNMNCSSYDFRSDNQKDIDIMIIRARKIFDSFTGNLVIIPNCSIDNFGNSMNRYYQRFHQYIDKINSDVYFEFSIVNSIIAHLYLVIYDIAIRIPTKLMSTGLGQDFLSNKRIPRIPNSENAVINVDGEIEDFIADYFDEYGCSF